MSDSFNTLRSTFNALMAFPAEDMKKAYKMMGDYAMDGKLPDAEESVAYGLFLSIKPLIDRSTKRSEAGRKGAEANLRQHRGNTEANLKQHRGNTEAKSKEERVKSKEINKNILSGKPDSVYQYAEVVDYLNEKAKTAFKDKSKDTRTHIKARFDEGFTLDDFKTVIDKKVSEWKGTDMAKYLRPATLFGSKFESYLNQQSGGNNKSFANFQQSETDWDDLAYQIMNKGAI